MIKAIIFDCFGVLVGSGFKDIYARAGGDAVKDADFIEDVLGSANLGLISSKTMHGQVAERLAMGYDDWLAHVDKGERPNQAILDYIKLLKTDYKVAVLSNANIGSLEKRLGHDNLALFDAVVVSAAVSMVKPDPAIYRYTANKLQVEPGECVFTDDSPLYVEGAREAGLKGVVYSDLARFKNDLNKLLRTN